MVVSTVTLDHTNRFNRIILDYVSGNEKLNAFISHRHELENYPKKMEERKAFPVNRELLAASLHKQYISLGGAEGKVAAQIDSLLDENTYTITTGHQLNIFTGPLYFFYKILHTIRLADELNKTYTDNHFVPIYWMNSEDHDIDEIGRFNLFGKKFVWEPDQIGATGRMDPTELQKFCDELEEVFSNNATAQELVGLFRKAYTRFDDLTQATRFFVNELFKDFGLVIIDSDDAELKRSFIPYLEEDIFKNTAHDIVSQTNKHLDDRGFHQQVNPRKINCFYLSKEGRHRIVKTEDYYNILHTPIKFSEEELRDELQKHPKRFSPNVVMRPLFQEFVLPNLTYVGGAGELAYWLQYKDFFEKKEVSFPMLCLRNHILLIPKRMSSRLKDLKLLPEDLFHSVDDLTREHVLELADAEVDLVEEMHTLNQLYKQLTDRALSIDPSLVPSIEAEQTRVKKKIAKWSDKFTRSLKKENDVMVNRIRKIHGMLFPQGFLQERHDNFLAFVEDDGDNKKLIKDIYAVIDPFGTEFTCVDYTSAVN